MQREIAASDLAPVIHISGADEWGKVVLLNFLLGWLDARGVEAFALGKPSDEESERPRFWRYWRLFPPRLLSRPRIGVQLQLL